MKSNDKNNTGTFFTKRRDDGYPKRAVLTRTLHGYVLSPLSDEQVVGMTNKFKLGDKVKIKNNSDKQIHTITSISKTNIAFPYEISGKTARWSNYELELVTEKTWDTLEVGDELKIKSQYRDEEVNRVLAVCGETVALSTSTNHHAFSSWWTKEELIACKYMIVGAEEENATELTLEEIAKKFKIPLDQLRIKD